DLVKSWLREADEVRRGTLRAELEAMRQELRKTQTPFHWMLEFPEVFCDDRADPLDGDRRNGKAWVDCFVGNPPYRGQSTMRSALGECYPAWLFALHEGTSGKCDLVAHFIRACGRFVGERGTLGLV